MASRRPRAAPVEKRPVGRPRKPETSYPIQFRLPKSVYDCYCVVSVRSGISVREIFRRLLILHAPSAQGPPVSATATPQPNPSPVVLPARRVARSAYLGR
jgi:hypothetical protein